MRRGRILLVMAAAIAALPWLLRVEPRRLDDEARLRLPCSFAKLKDGRTCFDLGGRSPAEVVVFVHGLTSPSYVWGKLPSMLRNAGYATMVYDLYGRGGSDRPWVDYNLDLFDRQLDALTRKVGLQRPVHLVGLSMGGIIATEFALRHPERVATVTLLDPGGFDVKVPALAGLFTTPVVGDWLMQVFGGRVVVASHTSLLASKNRVGDLLRQFGPQFEISGSRRALLSTLRRMPLDDFTARYGELGRSPLPVTVIWGRDDEVTPFAGAAIAARLLPRAEVHAIDGAGHLAHLDQPDLVLDALLGFLGTVHAPLQETRRGTVKDGIEAGAAPAVCRECEGRPARPRSGGYSRPGNGRADRDERKTE